MAGFWGKCRTTLRWCRFTAWFLILLILCLGIRLNHVGLPDFLKTRVIAALRENGVQLEFSRMRLSLVRGVVADNVHLGDVKNSDSFAFTAREIQLQLDYAALLRWRLQVDGLVVRDGRFTLAASPTNTLTLTNLQTELRFQANDTWTLDHFHAGFDNVQIQLAGEIAHASEIRSWKFFSAAKSAANVSTNGNKYADRGPLARLLQQISGPVARIHFDGQPSLNLIASGDARNVHSISVRLDAIVPAMRTPWFSTHNLQLAAQAFLPADAPTNFDAGWGFWTNLQPFQLKWTARTTDLHVEKMEADTLATDGEWRAPILSVKKFSAQIANGNLNSRADLDIAARVLTFTNDSNFDPHLLANWLTQKARARLADILWTQAPTLQVGGSLALPAWTNDAADWPDEIAPTVKLNGELAFTNAVADGATLDFLRTHFSYAKQFWNLSGFQLVQGRTHLQFDGDANETTQNFNGHLRGELEAASARPFLTASNLVENFNRFAFQEPLALDVTVRGNWRDWNSLGVTGSAALTNFSVKLPPSNHLAVDFLRTHFNYTNQFWNLSALELAQGKTRLQFDGETSDATENFIGRLRGAFDPESARPFLTTTDAVHSFEHLSLREPLVFNVNAAGNWRNLDALTATGSVALTNFSIRAQPADSLAGDFFYTNKMLEFFRPQLFRAGGTQVLKADAVLLDFVNGRIYFTNGFSTTEPMFVLRCIGPKTAKLIEPYQFPGPPTATVNGCSPMRDVKGGHDLDDADLTFVILKPTPFQWEKLRSPAMTGTIRWLGQKLVLTNIVAKVYDGDGTGNAYFDFTPAHPGSDFRFTMNVTNVDLHLLAADLSSPSNKLEGRLSGKLFVTNASSETWRSWNGYGDAQLRNGLLWNVPIFGLVSDGLNLFAPGLGNSRATDAATTFGLTNGVIFSDQLEMHTATMRLKYAGTVDLQQNVNARVTAQLLRNTPLIGPLVSMVLSPVGKIFECQITGQLGDPKIVPLWVPAPITDLLHPIRSVEKMFTPVTSTNAPAK
jgi:hypothetical protein